MQVRTSLRNTLTAATIAALTGLTQAATAQTYRPNVTFSGFGTLGYAVLNDDNAEYRTGVAIDGADNRGSLEVDTRLGLQADVTFNPDLSSTLQLTAREGEDGDAAVALEWGFLRWLPTDTIALRVGRMSLPVYSASDFRDVGFAMPYLRPSEDIYSMIPLRRFNGADISLDHQWKESLFHWQLFAGTSREKLFDDLAPHAKLAYGLSLIIENGPARIRLSHADAKVDIDSKSPAVTAVRESIASTLCCYPELEPILGPVADDFAGVAVPFSFDAISLNLTFSRIFIDAELTRRRVDSWVSNVDGWSFAIGTRLGKFQPYMYISDLHEPDGDRRIALSDKFSLDPLVAGINQFYAPRDQSTIGIGARYDLGSSIALKAQVDRISRQEIGISFNRTDVDDGSDEGKDVTLVSLALDFVF